MVISIESIGRFMLLGAEIPTLKEACAKFVNERGPTLTQDNVFRQQVESCPELGLMLYEILMPKLNVSTSQEGLCLCKAYI